jgi:hypothetical protein
MLKFGSPALLVLLILLSYRVHYKGAPGAAGWFQATLFMRFLAPKVRESQSQVEFVKLVQKQAIPTDSYNSQGTVNQADKANQDL